MLNTFKSFLVLGVVLGLLAGCSSNSGGKENTDNDMGSDTTETTTSGVDNSGVSSTDTEEDPMDAIRDVATVFYFEFDSAVLNAETRAALTAHASYINSDSSVMVRLEGHADERGSREYNMALGERRANAVRDFLAIRGVPRSKIEVVSYGEERPAVQGSDEYSWSQNRRVEIKYN